MILTVILISSYLIGSIPTAVWISKIFYGTDIRTFGSGNAGSTNMFRTFGFTAGISTQLIDILKGVIAALLPWLILNPLAFGDWQILMSYPFPIPILLCGICATIGHIWPILAGFRGGKGVNTLLGTMIVADYRAALVALGVFIIVLLLFKMVSLSSMLGTLSFPCFVFLTGNFPDQNIKLITVAIGFFMFLLVVYTHRTNLKRIIAGNESKVKLFGKK